MINMTIKGQNKKEVLKQLLEIWLVWLERGNVDVQEVHVLEGYDPKFSYSLTFQANRPFAMLSEVEPHKADEQPQQKKEIPDLKINLDGIEKEIAQEALRLLKEEAKANVENLTDTVSSQIFESMRGRFERFDKEAQKLEASLPKLKTKIYVKTYQIWLKNLGIRTKNSPIGDVVIADSDRPFTNVTFSTFEDAFRYANENSELIISVAEGKWIPGYSYFDICEYYETKEV
jgi:hypothetical protein